MLIVLYFLDDVNDNKLCTVWFSFYLSSRNLVCQQLWKAEVNNKRV